MDVNTAMAAKAAGDVLTTAQVKELLKTPADGGGGSGTTQTSLADEEAVVLG